MPTILPTSSGSVRQVVRTSRVALAIRLVPAGRDRRDLAAIPARRHVDRPRVDAAGGGRRCGAPPRPGRQPAAGGRRRGRHRGFGWHARRHHMVILFVGALERVRQSGHITNPVESALILRNGKPLFTRPSGPGSAAGIAACASLCRHGRFRARRERPESQRLVLVLPSGRRRPAAGRARRNRNHGRPRATTSAIDRPLIQRERRDQRVVGR